MLKSLKSLRVLTSTRTHAFALVPVTGLIRGKGLFEAETRFIVPSRSEMLIWTLVQILLTIALLVFIVRMIRRRSKQLDALHQRVRTLEEQHPAEILPVASHHNVDK
ncbi:MAG: hypothetical protein NVSMB57_07860 [Actinomycetota bacterium]